MGMRVEGLQINGKVYLFLFWEGAKMFGGSRSRVARLGLNLGNFIYVLFFLLSFSLSICSSRTRSLVTSTFLFRSSYL